MMDPIIPTTPSKAALETTLSHDSGLAKQNGFEETELKRDRFNAWSVIGIQFSITAAPLAVLSYVGLVTGVGGTSYFFWCYVVSIVGQLLVAASLAEIAAILPHASGTLLPPRYFGYPFTDSLRQDKHSGSGLSRHPSRRAFSATSWGSTLS